MAFVLFALFDENADIFLLICNRSKSLSKLTIIYSKNFKKNKFLNPESNLSMLRSMETGKNMDILNIKERSN